MMIGDHADEFGGLPVEEFELKTGVQNASGIAYRLTLGYEKEEEGIQFSDLFEKYLSYPQLGEIKALVIGCWDSAFEGGGSESCVEQLVAASEKLPGLKHLFLGDIICEESEISWIVQTDVSALFAAFPQLEELRIRGANGLGLGRVNHSHLKKLVIESGGLGVEVVREVCSATLPQLEHLELWLGVENYGGDTTVADLEPILSGALFPNLKYLGLRDSEIADEIAKALAEAPILDRLEELDLSMGILGDEGAQALLDSKRLNHLKKLDLHYHYMSEAMCEQLNQLGIDVDVDDKQEPDVYDGEEERYCEVTE